jgi:peptide/nickel transport system substrate-binding protein
MTTRRIVVGCARLPTALDREQKEGLLQWENKDAHLQVYEPLLTYRGRRIGRTMRMKRAIDGLAAVSVQATEDRRRYRIRLREAIVAATGHRLTAEDVEWTFRRSISLASVGAWVIGRAGLRSADQVRAVSELELEVVLDHPSSLFPHLLTVMVPAIIDTSAVRPHLSATDPWGLAWLRENSAGFGPYSTALRDGRAVFEANPAYWRGKPFADQIDFVAIASADDRWRALESGEVDLAYDLEVAPGIYPTSTVTTLPTAWRYALALNCVTPPFDDPEMRRAVALALPYDRIVAEMPSAKLMTSCLPDVVWGHRPVDPQPRYDPSLARELIRNAGSRRDVVVLTHDGSDQFTRLGDLVLESLQAVGLDASLQVVRETEHDRLKLEHRAHVILDHFGPQVMDGRYALGHDVNPPRGSVFDITGYHSNVVAGLLEDAEADTDDRRIEDRLATVQQVVMTDLPWVPIAQQQFTFGVRKGLGGLRQYPLPRLRLRELEHQGT